MDNSPSNPQPRSISRSIAPLLDRLAATGDHRDPRTAVVAAQSPEGLTQPRPQIDLAQIAPEQFQPAVRGERLGDELDREITLDHPPQGRYRQAHQRGLQCARERIGVFSLETALEASLIHVARCFPSRLFADWGLTCCRPWMCNRHASRS
jgi:hypothetical protein